MNIYITSLLGVFIHKRKTEAFFTSPRDFSVISFRLRGNSFFYMGEKAIHASEKGILYVPENIAYRQENESDDEIIAIHFKANKDIFAEITAISPNDVIFTEELFKKAFFLYTLNPEKNHFACLSVLYDILNLFIEEKEEGYPSSLTKAIDIIQKSYSDPSFSIGLLAEASGISDAYLRMLFSKYLKTSPVSYLKKLRFSRAKQLLSTGYYSVKTVSLMCGYENEKNFSVSFKKETGKSPSEYKK